MTFCDSTSVLIVEDLMVLKRTVGLEGCVETLLKHVLHGYVWPVGYPWA